MTPAAIDEDLDLSHLHLARTAQPADETDVPVFEDDEDDDPRAAWWC